VDTPFQAWDVIPGCTYHILPGHVPTEEESVDPPSDTSIPEMIGILEGIVVDWEGSLDLLDVDTDRVLTPVNIIFDSAGDMTDVDHNGVERDEDIDIRGSIIEAIYNFEVTEDILLLDDDYRTRIWDLDTDRFDPDVNWNLVGPDGPMVPNDGFPVGGNTGPEDVGIFPPEQPPDDSGMMGFPDHSDPPPISNHTTLNIVGILSDLPLSVDGEPTPILIVPDVRDMSITMTYGSYGILNGPKHPQDKEDTTGGNWKPIREHGGATGVEQSETTAKLEGTSATTNVVNGNGRTVSISVSILALLVLMTLIFPERKSI